MTTETKFREASETFNENVTNGIKWMQDTTNKLIETQKQQMKTATDMFNNMFAVNPSNSSNNFNNSFGVSSKAMMEIYQKNMESINNLLRTTGKPITEYVKFTDKETFSKEMDKQVESFFKQMKELTLLNQTNFNSIQKQVDSTTKSFTPLMEQFGKELENSAKSSMETLQTIMDANNDFATPSIEAGKEAFEKIKDQMKTNLDASIKFWSDLTKSTTSTITPVKTQDTKAENEFVKISPNTSNKKQAEPSLK